MTEQEGSHMMASKWFGTCTPLMALLPLLRPHEKMSCGLPCEVNRDLDSCSENT